MSQASFRKQQREKARRERAAAKFAKRTEKASEPAPEPAPPPSRSQEAVLADLADLHAKFEDGKVTFDDFEDKKQQLTDELDVR